MPLLKDLSCAIELSDSQQTLQEFGTVYGDGFVETFVAVPSKPQAFSVHLTSNTFIAPGLALYVFIDGVYQCNRNRQDLKLHKQSDSRSLVDFRVRQKEEKQKDGSMIAREWTFEKLDSVKADDAPAQCSPNILDNIGCIEVVVLRCAGSRNAKTVSNMNLDGASEQPDYYLGLDGQDRENEGQSTYDDRGPFVSGFSNGYGPPPPVSSYRSPYFETAHSHGGTTSRGRHSTRIARDQSSLASLTRQSQPHSRYSGHTSPRARSHSSLPQRGFQYGSGPIPPEGESFHHHPHSKRVAEGPGVDSLWLDELVTKAVKQGIEESRRGEENSEANRAHKQRITDVDIVSQLPGAWPLSPFASIAQPYQQSVPSKSQTHNREEDQRTHWSQPQGEWGNVQNKSRRSTGVTWNTDPEWENESSPDAWGSNEETPGDSWDTDETWTTMKPKLSNTSRRRGRSRAPIVHSHFSLSSWSPVTAGEHNQRGRKENRSRKSRSKPNSQRSGREARLKRSSEDADGWTHVEDPLSPVISWGNSDDSVLPSSPHSHDHTSRNRGKSTRHPKAFQNGKERMSSRYTHHDPAKLPAPTNVKHAPSDTNRVAPTMMNTPASIYPVRPSTVHSRKPSIHSGPAASVVPPPSWGCAMPDRTMKKGFASANMPPAPYAATLNEFVHTTVGNSPAEKRSPSSSSWGSQKGGGTYDPGPDSTNKKNSWSDSDDDGWNDTTFKVDDNSWKVTTNNQTDVLNKANDVKDKHGSANAWKTPKTNWTITNDADVLEKNGKSNDVRWNTDNLWMKKEEPAKAMSTSKRHTGKSLSKYRQLRSTSSDFTPKLHWQFPPQPLKQQLFPVPEEHNGTRVEYIAPKEPLYKISKKMASEKGIEHQVRAGKGMLYGHVVGRPEYLDRFDKPVSGLPSPILAQICGRVWTNRATQYAVFRFKYRSRSILKSMFGSEVPNHGHLTQSTPGSAIAKAKEKLKDLPQDQLIEKMLKLQTKLAQKELGHERYTHKHQDRRPSDTTEVVARILTEDWVKRHSRGPTEKTKTKFSSVGTRKKGPKEAPKQVAGDGEEWLTTPW
ncbi:hypothetical protein BKA66DRAFT_589376 [Pyrenochaeta sp. MPI-SDFR-AT-0127]|nr:hypothetical protein BKA66DRAFT_589376 [Pyrenochaeta sp. MPI-SDFR-AT-0127]